MAITQWQQNYKTTNEEFSAIKKCICGTTTNLMEIHGAHCEFQPKLKLSKILIANCNE